MILRRVVEQTYHQQSAPLSGGGEKARLPLHASGVARPISARVCSPIAHSWQSASSKNSYIAHIARRVSVQLLREVDGGPIFPARRASRLG